jgi:hypothetical protein
MRAAQQRAVRRGSSRTLDQCLLDPADAAQTALHRASVSAAFPVWAELYEQLQDTSIVREYADGPRFNLGENAFVEVLLGVRYRAMLAHMLTALNGD